MLDTTKKLLNMNEVNNVQNRKSVANLLHFYTLTQTIKIEINNPFYNYIKKIKLPRNIFNWRGMRSVQ